MTVLDLEKVLSRVPNLTANGIGPYSVPKGSTYAEQVAIGRAELLRPESLDMCAAAAQWLRTECRKVKTPTVSSYELKHRFEDHAGIYVYNGCMIAAAVHLDFAWSPWSVTIINPVRHRGPSPILGVSLLSLRRIFRENDEKRNRK